MPTALAAITAITAFIAARWVVPIRPAPSVARRMLRSLLAALLGGYVGFAVFCVALLFTQGGLALARGPAFCAITVPLAVRAAASLFGYLIRPRRAE